MVRIGWGEEGEPTQKSPMTVQEEVGLVNPEEPAHSRYTPGGQLLPVWVLQTYRPPVIRFISPNVEDDLVCTLGKES